MEENRETSVPLPRFFVHLLLRPQVGMAVFVLRLAPLLLMRGDIGIGFRQVALLHLALPLMPCTIHCMLSWMMRSLS
jgi:hypothetical protein